MPIGKSLLSTIMIAPILFSDIKISACLTFWSFKIVQIFLFLFSFKKSSSLVKISYDLLIIPDTCEVVIIS